jgi:hypothetical protein
VTPTKAAFLAACSKLGLDPVDLALGLKCRDGELRAAGDAVILEMVRAGISTQQLMRFTHMGRALVYARVARLVKATGTEAPRFTEGRPEPVPGRRQFAQVDPVEASRIRRRVRQLQESAA